MTEITIGDGTLVSMYRKMLEVRRFEEKIRDLYMRGEVPGLPHLSIGQEAVSVGVCNQLRNDDFVVSSHRGHGHGIAKGIQAEKVAAEILCRERGCCKGRGGTMRIADIEIGVVYSSPIVGGNIPLATGAGLSIKLRGTDQVSVAFFGDGAANIGSFHESLNLASIWKLPVIYVCENNHYAISTHVTRATSAKNIGDRGVAYNIPGMVIDGNDVIAVYEAAKKAVARARNGDGPSLIECKTYRWTGHHIGDPGTAYRPKEEIDLWKAKDPINRFKTLLLEKGVLTESEIERISFEAGARMEKAIEYAKDSPYPPVEDLHLYVYAD